MAQQALQDIAFADKNHFAIFAPKAIDTQSIGSFKFDPRLTPGVVMAFDLCHAGPPRQAGAIGALYKKPGNSNALR